MRDREVFRRDCEDLASRMFAIGNQLAELANSGHPVFTRWARARQPLRSVAHVIAIAAQYIKTLRMQ